VSPGTSYDSKMCCEGFGDDRALKSLLRSICMSKFRALSARRDIYGNRLSRFPNNVQSIT